MEEGGVFWLTGLAGSGKSYLCELLCEKLREEFSNTIYLDGDLLRELLGDFDYDRQGRLANAMRRAKFAKFLSEQGQIVVVSTISMFNEIYRFNRENLKNYLEIFIKCDFDELLKRDKKGLYSGALSGKIKNVVGVDLKFDPPKPHLTIDNTHFTHNDEKIREILEAFGGLKF